jgi:hypothetical protein
MMDDAHLREVEQDLAKLKGALTGHNYTIVNQEYMLRQYDREGKIIQIDENEIVKNDLELLKKSNLHIIDFNFQPYFYVGCICELVYSHLYKIPSILIVPDQSYFKRPWLNFHSDIIVSEYSDIAKAISKLNIAEVE